MYAFTFASISSAVYIDKSAKRLFYSFVIIPTDIVYESLKTTGISTIERQGLFFAMPGFHVPIVFSTRSTSALSTGTFPLRMVISLTEPSTLMIKVMFTVPESWFSFAEAGYCRVFVSHFMNSTQPPGGVGVSERIRLLTLSS